MPTSPGTRPAGTANRPSSILNSCARDDFSNWDKVSRSWFSTHCDCGCVVRRDGDSSVGHETNPNNRRRFSSGGCRHIAHHCHSLGPFRLDDSESTPAPVHGLRSQPDALPCSGCPPEKELSYGGRASIRLGARNFTSHLRAPLRGPKAC